jgi:hypothetical protein
MSSGFSCTPISPSYHPALHYRPTIPTDYLPSDEHRYLVKQQHRALLETHFAQPSISPSHRVPSKTAYQKQGNPSRSQRVKISEDAYATRAAIGPNFDFTDEMFDRLQASKNKPKPLYNSWEDEDWDEEPIPARYIAEFNVIFRNVFRDSESRYSGQHYDSDDDMMAVWRLAHSGTYDDDITSLLYRKATAPPCERHDSGYEQRIAREPTPQPQSKFDWDSSDDEDEDDNDDEKQPKKSLWARARKSLDAVRVPHKVKKRRTW